MNNLIWIYTRDVKRTKLIRKFYEYGINILETKEENNKTLFLVSKSDLKKLKKFTVYKFKIYGKSGLEKVINIIKENKWFYLAVLFGIVLVFFLSNVVVSVEVIHSKKEIRELLKDELEEHGLKRLTLKKNFAEITKIKDSILEENKERLEWLEIEEKGMKYIIHVEERIITETKDDASYCHIIAKRDGIITKLHINTGVSLVKMGQSVSKNDVLISGDILLNEEVVSNVCASGNVYGEVWYTVNVEMPIYYDKITKTGKKRYNLMIEHDNKESIILRSRLNEKEVSSKKLIGFLGYNLYFQIEEEVTKEKKKYQEIDLEKEAIKKGIEKLKMGLDKDIDIISQKVLKKSINDSKIYLELFVAVEENIGTVQVIE